MQARSAREKGAGIEDERLLVGDTGWDFVSVAIEDLTVARGNDGPPTDTHCTGTPTPDQI